ncbi:alpha-ketoglutarate-dependent dioxygenase AlkB [Segetibacter sp.]|jgi:alkylated DNA repair dioxygenase AlkB|uniref:alpha-ketoglutarate-dependent dioxygenase AlkB n=1 Tax=Segetibacter sp. TaxID=2231182 RepID=UPI00260B7F2F|nr:alpha-ketoglutarate-dependent dioxygenase AlkB [Segetibacter sp.]MCW3079584.1 2OG-Fe(II) oxygenase [Segetibacter sp.]
MNTLFPIEPTYPEGFSYVPNFITADEEDELHRKVSKIELHNFNFQGFTANRKVASFGYDYSFDNGGLTKGKDIPQAFHFLVNKVNSHLALKPGQFAELLITEYPSGSVINWHRDAPPFDIIAGISIMADCTFRLRPQDKVKQGRGSVISLPVNRRSLYIIQGPARTDWQHSISPVKETRYSITLRTLRP